MTELITLYDIITYPYGKWMIIYFNLPFEGKKTVIKKAVPNKKVRHCSTPNRGQLYNEICGLVS